MDEKPTIIDDVRNIDSQTGTDASINVSNNVNKRFSFDAISYFIKQVAIVVISVTFLVGLVVIFWANSNQQTDGVSYKKDTNEEVINVKKGDSETDQTDVSEIDAISELNTNMKSGLNDVSASIGVTCAINSEHKLYCWGSNGAWQTGNNSSSAVTAIDTSGVLKNKDILSVSVGMRHVCALASDNLVYCWGDDDSIGVASSRSTNVNYPTGSSTPVAVDTSGVLSGKTIKSISAGDFHTCAIADDNLAYCWGHNVWGELGNNSNVNSLTPVAVDTSGVLSGKTIKSISAGGFFSCALASDDNAYCWGSTSYGELGDGGKGTFAGSQTTPVAVDKTGVLKGKKVLSISAGTENACVIADDYNVYCWGMGSSGQFGNGSTESSTVPVAVDTSGVLKGKKIMSVAVGNSHVCVLDSEGKVYCWGHNGVKGSVSASGVDKIYGQLGSNQDITESLVPIAVDMLGALKGKTILSIAAGSFHTCAISSDDHIYCWGFNDDGQLGDNSNANRNTPIVVEGL